VTQITENKTFGSWYRS